MLQCIILLHQCSWKENQLVGVVGKETTRAITTIPLPQGPIEDCLRFLGDELASYSVQKAHNFISQNNAQLEMDLVLVLITISAIQDLEGKA